MLIKTIFAGVNIHEIYLKRCIELAHNGLGTTYPNPLVGCVIIHDNNIIGEGWHQKAGGPHAEVIAVNSVQDKGLLKNSTLYVSLEPCSHFGKTPPCSDLIIANSIKNVVVGTLDPFEKVSGRGIKKLIDAGCNVQLGFLEDDCHELNKRFFTYQLKKRPYIILKWAESSDGFISPPEKEKKAPFFISNEASQQLVHKWRSEEMAILVGTNTVLEDNPKLNTRHWHGNSPIRVVIDRLLKTPKSSHVWDKSIKTIFITEKSLPPDENLFFERVDFKESLAGQVCEVLYRHGIQSVIVEGGRATLQTFINEGLWDEARVFTSVITIKYGTEAPKIKGNIVSEKNIGTDKLTILKNNIKTNLNI